jgi:hypothetical protein
MIAVFPPFIAASVLSSEIVPAIDLLLESTKRKILAPAIETIAILHNCIQKVDGSEYGLPLDVGQFTNNFAPKLGKVTRQVTKKVDQRTLGGRCTEIRAVFDGGDNEIELELNNQSVVIVGARLRTAVDAIRRVAVDAFQRQMCENLLVHELLGFRLRERSQVIREKRKWKALIDADRATAKKVKEQGIAKERKKREKQREGELEDE